MTLKTEENIAESTFSVVDNDLFRDNINYLQTVKSHKLHSAPGLSIDPETQGNLKRADRTISAIGRLAAHFAKTGFVHAKIIEQARNRLEGMHELHSDLHVQTADLTGIPHHHVLARLAVAGMVLNYLEDKIEKKSSASEQVGNLSVARGRT